MNYIESSIRRLKNVEKCSRIIESNNKRRFGRGSIVETGIAGTSAVHSARKEQLKEARKEESLTPLLQQAREIYGTYRIWTSDG